MPIFPTLRNKVVRIVRYGAHHFFVIAEPIYADSWYMMKVDPNTALNANNSSAQ
jgi:hypothetical protein